MQKLVSLLREAACGGLTIGRTIIHVGKATVEIVIRVVVHRRTR